MWSTVFNCCTSTTQSDQDQSSPLHHYFATSKHFDHKGGIGEFTSEKQVEINDQMYDTDLVAEEIDIVIRILRRNWVYMQSLVLHQSEIMVSDRDELIQARKDINACLQGIVYCIKKCECETLKLQYLNYATQAVNSLVRPLILSLANLELKFSIRQFSDGEKCPFYQHLHTFMDLQFYLLLLDEMSLDGYSQGPINCFKGHLSQVVKDLITVAQKNYHSTAPTAFVCPCVKNLWLIVQMMTERNFCDDSDINYTFWTIFNEHIENKDNDFVLWLLNNVSALQGHNTEGQYTGCLSDRIKPNYPTLEFCLKIILTNRPTNITSVLTSIRPIVCDLWLKNGRIEVYQLLWEHFSKRLNYDSKIYNHHNNSYNHFKPSNNDCVTLSELVDLTDTILWTPQDCNSGDFEMFLAMLVAHLGHHPHHWGKMKGRIYSQLGPNKVRDLDEVGIFRVLLLFVVLSKVNVDEVTKKFLGFVEGLPAERRQTQIVWNFYMCIMVRHMRENRSLEPILPPFQKMLEQASQDPKLHRLVRLLVSNLQTLTSPSVTSNLRLHQWLLLDTWLHKYTTTCHHQELVALMTALIAVMDRVAADQAWCEWEPSFKNHVYPPLKYAASSYSAPEICGTVAGTIAILSTAITNEAFNFFSGEGMMPRVSAAFLCVILRDYPSSIVLSAEQEAVALQCWVKLCLLRANESSGLCDSLTGRVVKLDVIPAAVRARVRSGDHLRSLIDGLYEIGGSTNLNSLVKFSEICFGNTDRWITQYLTQPESQTGVARIYDITSHLFLKLGNLIYNRHKGSTPLVKLVSVLLLPTELMMGKSLHPFVIESVKSSWTIFFRALHKLNAPNDAYIERVLRDLVTKFVPHFPISDSPMLKCLDDAILGGAILDKMAATFLKQSTQEAESNVFKTLRIICDFVQGTTSEESLKLVVNRTLFGICEIVMFHSQKSTAVSAIKCIVSSPLFAGVKSDFSRVVLAISEKHLAFNSGSCFQLMAVLGRFVPGDLRNLLGDLKRIVSNVERLRGVGFDKTLRVGLDRLEAGLANQTSS